MSSHFFPDGLPQRHGSSVKSHKSSNKDPNQKYDWFLGTGRHREALISEINFASSCEVNVVITGETGTGKEIVAKWVHEQRKKRLGLSDEDAPFLAVNCAALPEELIESLLFGHERGAFTSARHAQPGKLELAKQGTLFLDEIQNLGLSGQSKLLRAVQSRVYERLGAKKGSEMQCRVITASNVPLEILLQNNSFRKDLYYRLNICPIYLPALRHRKEDLPGLIKYFLKRISIQFQGPNKELSSEAFEKLLNHNWPGNLRELEHSLMFACIRSSRVIECKDLPATLTGKLDEFIEGGTWC